MPRFDRAYSLIVGPAGGTGIEIAQTLRISFDIHKTKAKHPNRSKIFVFNLAPNNRELLERANTRCVLKVGYFEEGGPVECYQGDVYFAFSKYEGPNVVTELELGEGAKAIRDSMVSLGYGKGVSSTQAIRDVAGNMGLALNMPSDVPERTWENGLSFHGPARTRARQDHARHGLAGASRTAACRSSEPAVRPTVQWSSLPATPA